MDKEKGKNKVDEHMKYSVDRIENNIVVLEELTTKEKIEIEVSSLPEHIKEGSIISKENNTYIIDEETEKNRRNNLRDRFNRLKK